MTYLTTQFANEIAAFRQRLGLRPGIETIYHHHFGDSTLELVGRGFSIRMVRDRGQCRLELKPGGSAAWIAAERLLDWVKAHPRPGDPLSIGEATAILTGIPAKTIQQALCGLDR